MPTMTTIELPRDVAHELLLAANSKNQTVGDYIIFLMAGEYHPGNFLPEGEYHPPTTIPSSPFAHEPRQPNYGVAEERSNGK